MLGWAGLAIVKGAPVASIWILRLGSVDGFFGDLGAGVAGGKFEEGVAGPGEGRVERRDQAQIARDVDALHMDNLHKTLLELVDDVNMRHEADAKSGNDEAFEKLARVKLHRNPACGLVLDKEVVDEFAAGGLPSEQENSCLAASDKVRRFDKGERVAGGNDKNEAVFVDQLHMQTRVADRKRNDAEFHLSIEDQLKGLRALRTHNIQSDLRILLLEFADQNGKDVKGGGVVGADSQAATRCAFHVGEGEADLFELDEGVFREGLERFAGSGECDLAAAAIQKPMAEMGFKRADLRRDGRLGYMQLFGGP